MKVKELIEQLKNVDPEADVLVSIDRNEDTEEDERWMISRCICLVNLKNDLPECVGIH